MKNFSGITDNLDITTKKYVDDGLASKANLAGNNTFTGGQTITGANAGYSVNASGYVKGSWLQSSITDINGANGGHASNGTGRVCVFDGAGWIYYRTPAEIVAEAGGSGGSTEVVQTTGTSTTSVMSQKATTDELAKKANLSGGNNFTGPQRLNSSYLFLMGDDNYQGPLLDCFDEANQSDSIFAVHKTGTDAGEVRIGDGIATAPVMLCGNAGTSGQVFTSQGAGKTPVWKELVTLDTDQDITAEKKFLNTLIVGAKDDGSTGFKVIQGDVAGGDILFTVNINGIDLDAHEHNIPLLIGGNAGTSGQVLTSQGAGKAPQWKSMPTYTLSGTTLTITLP